MKIRIDVPVYNRKQITELCLMQLNKTKGPDDQIFIYNDGSTEYDNEWLSQFGRVINYTMPVQDRWRNIHKIRSLAYRDFVNSDFDFLYMTDNDAFHDSSWRSMLLYIFNKCNMPVSGYISSFMYNNYSYYKEQMRNLSNIMMNNDYNVVRSTGGGISIFLDANRVKQIVARMGNRDMHDIWDCETWNMLNNTYAISTSSYLDHFGKGGLHHQDWNNERAINPTSYLQNVRQPIIDYLEGNITRDEIISKI